jgi:NitT/TauT family transport system ATP-binding protein
VSRTIELTAVPPAGARGTIDVLNVEKGYGTGVRLLQALEETSVRADPGDFVSIVGPSGCGKTTLLKLIGDIIQPSSGAVLIDQQLARSVREAREIGYVFQTPVLLPWLTVRRNVALPLEIAKSGSRAENKRRVNEILETVGLAEIADRLPRELSGGMQARVGIARALVNEPRILLMDEPFAALDELTRTEMAFHLLDLWDRIKTTVVFVTHHIEEAVLLSNRVLVMSSRPGRIRRSIEIPLPRPRTLQTRESDVFRDICADLVRDFHTKQPAV